MKLKCLWFSVFILTILLVDKSFGNSIGNIKFDDTYVDKESKFCKGSYKMLYRDSKGYPVCQPVSQKVIKI